ncbi:hypothetical protein Dimus_033643 [Dionaea muscipula]
MTVIHLKKKDIVKSKVRGVEVEFDHEKLATILGIPGNNGICEYVKDVWEESKYIKPLEITRRRRINLPRVMMRHMAYVISVKDHELSYGDGMTMVFKAFGIPLVNKKGEEPKRYDFFEETFLTMCKLRREDGIWWIGSGDNRRKDDDVDEPEGQVEKEEERNKDDFDWEALIDEATVEGESGSDDQFYDAQVEVEEPRCETPSKTSRPAPSSAQQKDKEPSGVDPSCPTGRIPEAEYLKFQAEFERKRANRFHDDLEKAEAENARLLALLHQAQTKPHP